MKVIFHLILTTVLLFPALSRAQEEPSATPSANNAGIWTFHAGIGSPKAWNYAGLTREYLLDDHTSYYVTGGLGTALIGVGMAYYGKREDDGLVATATVGVVDLQATLGYQLRLGKHDYITAGGTYGLLFMQCYCWLPVLSYEHRY